MSKRRLEANIIIDTPHVRETDAVLLFGRHGSASVDEPITHLPAETSWADLMVQFGIFPSKGQARKAGWTHPIPEGWSEISVGKLSNTFWVWKPGGSDE